MARKNRELEQNLADIEGVLKSKEADLRDQIDRAQKAEVDALNARRERSALEEKVIFFGVISLLLQLN